MSDPFCRHCREPLAGHHNPNCVWEHTVVPSECTGVIEEAMATVKARKSADYARGVADERARVVADLREWGWRLSKHGRTVLLEAAERIEKNRKKAT